MKYYQISQEGYYSKFGGTYIPEIQHKCISKLQEIYLSVLQDECFKKEFEQLLHDYVGRATLLYHAHRLSEKYGCKIYLKREDLNHTGSHKINNNIGQILLTVSGRGDKDMDTYLASVSGKSIDPSEPLSLFF